MSSRERTIDREAQSLWKALHEESPPDVGGRVLLELILSGVEAPAYDRLRSPFLNSAQITRPEAWRERRDS